MKAANRGSNLKIIIGACLKNQGREEVEAKAHNQDFTVFILFLHSWFDGSYLLMYIEHITTISHLLLTMIINLLR